MIPAELRLTLGADSHQSGIASQVSLPGAGALDFRPLKYFGLDLFGS